MSSQEAIKVSPYEAEPLVFAQRVNYKLVDPTTVGSKHLTFGMVIVEPGGVCNPGHAHDEQEEIFFCLSGAGVVIAGDKREELEIHPWDAVFFPPHVYHNLKNPSNIPLVVLWIQSPAGWVFDKDPEMDAKARRGDQ